VHFSPQKLITFLVVVLNTQAGTAKVTTPTLQPSPDPCSKKTLKLSPFASGALTTYYYKLRPQDFTLALHGARAPSVPLATPIEA